jgi:hypothetical protein
LARDDGGAESSEAEKLHEHIRFPVDPFAGFILLLAIAVMYIDYQGLTILQ